MLEGQAAFRRSWWRKEKECQGQQQQLSYTQGVPNPALLLLFPHLGARSLTFCLEYHGCWLSSPYYHHPLNPNWCLKVAFGVC